MKKKIEINNIIYYVCILFTVATVISSSIQLIQGRKYDMNAHILLRGAISTIAIIFIVIFKYINIKNIYLRSLVQYILSMTCIFTIVYFLGFFIELARTAYKDIFFNYTIPFIIIGTIIILRDKRKVDKGEKEI